MGSDNNVIVVVGSAKKLLEHKKFAHKIQDLNQGVELEAESSEGLNEVDNSGNDSDLKEKA